MKSLSGIFGTVSRVLHRMNPLSVGPYGGNIFNPKTATDMLKESLDNLADRIATSTPENGVSEFRRKILWAINGGHMDKETPSKTAEDMDLGEALEAIIHSATGAQAHCMLTGKSQTDVLAFAQLAKQAKDYYDAIPEKERNSNKYRSIIPTPDNLLHDIASLAEHHPEQSVIRLTYF